MAFLIGFLLSVHLSTLEEDETNRKIINFLNDHLNEKIIKDFSTKGYETLRNMARNNPDYNDLRFSMGATKCVICHGENVVKVPFAGRKIIQCTRGVRSEIFKNFTGSSALEGSTGDYCYDEVLLYKKAEEEGLDKFFLKLEPLTTVNGVNIYTQQMIRPIKKDFKPHKSKNERVDNFLKQNPHKRIYMDPFFLNELLILYGEEEVNKLYNFLNRYHIEDLHDGNLGYIKECSEPVPKIFDYGGFRQDL